MKDDEYLCFDFFVEEHIAHVRFNRAALHNRFDRELHSEFPAVLEQMARNKYIRACIISAEGRSFSAGGDLELILEGNASSAVRERLTAEARSIIYGLLDLPFPVLAAVHGATIGLGASVIGCCDIVVACRDAQIADPHVLLGLVAGDGGILAWSQSVGIMRAKRYLLTGDAISGAEAHAMGMVTDLVEKPEDVLPAAVAIAEKLVKLPRGGVRGTKQAFAELTRELLGAAFERSLAYEMETLSGDEVFEVVSRALTKK
ncbi:enoyl-CoA hydratase/isomerase family protein [Haliea sp.]